MKLLLLLALLESDALLDWLDRLAQHQLDQRAATVAAITTRNAAEARQHDVRAKLLAMLGGLPQYHGPLNAKIVATLPRPGFRIEKLYFESLPRYYVTANLYVPDAPGKHPAVLFAMGHWDQGKAAAQQTASNLARKGFFVLAYDPVGQAERLQVFNPATGKSALGGGTDQHIASGGQALLLGQSFARYRIFDGVRALDYLESRPEVDATRIGCTGCSGGGTLATYISALDPRVKVAAPACYITSFRLLFRGSVGDSEQSLPGFLAAGLDLADWIELAAPKPYLISSTKEDFFPLEGARMAYEDARRFYGLFDAADRIRWNVGPGGHGTPVEVREGIYEWMLRHLNGGVGNPKEEEFELLPDKDLIVVPSGQVNIDLRSRELWEVLGEQVPPPAPEDATALRAELRRLTTEPAPALAPQMSFTPGERRDYAVLVVETTATPTPCEAEGRPVLRVTPRGLPLAKPPARLPGDWLAATRALMVGQNLPGLRARDILTAADELAGKHGVRRIHAYAQGTAGVWLLMAAALDERIERVSIDRTPATLVEAVQSPVQRDVHDAVIPGVLARWDLPALVAAIAPRQVTWTNPTAWSGAAYFLAGTRHR